MTKPDAVKAFNKLSKVRKITVFKMACKWWRKDRPWRIEINSVHENYKAVFTTYKQVTRFLEGK